MIEADTIVVGSGAGGAVVAATLAEAGEHVVLLEEGRHYTPAQYGAMRPSEMMRRMWRDAGLTFALGVGDTPMINVMMGKCVGGSSVLTGGVCFRTPEHVVRSWRLAGYSPEELAPVFEQVEKDIHVETVPESARSASTQAFARGAAALQRPLEPLRRNTDGCKGHSRCNFGCPVGAKRSVDVAYLPRAFARGAELFSEHLVERVTHERGRATGVEGHTPQGRFTARARKRVVVAAGAYHTPLLLRASGLRHEDLGRHLTLHPSFRVMARFDEPLYGWRGALQSAWSDAFEARGITLVGMFVPPGILAATMPGIGPRHRANAAQIPHMGVFGGLVHDEGGGTVRRGFGREPIVTYRMAAKDRAAVPTLIREMAATWFAAGAREVVLPVLGMEPVTRDTNLDFLDRLPARKLECSSQHPLGTCRLGTVLDESGESRELKGLYVADGSIVPTSLGVNPQLTIMTLAMKIARGMLS